MGQSIVNCWKWIKIDKGGRKWVTMVEDSEIWVRVMKSGWKWSNIAENDIKK